MWRYGLVCLLIAGCGGGQKDAPPTAPAVDASVEKEEPKCEASIDADVQQASYWRERLGDRDAEVLPGLTRASWWDGAMGLLGQPAAGDPLGEMLRVRQLPDGGSFTVDLAKVGDPGERLVLIDSAAAAGVVLLEAGDRRMIWLGRDAHDAPRVLGPAAECGQDAKMLVTTLDPARLTRIVGFARAAGPQLAGAATERAALPVRVPTGKACDDSQSAAIFISPRRPSSEQTMRVIATLSGDPGPVELVLIAPDGTRHAPEMVRLGGPPFSYVIAVDAPAAGSWTAVIGDGDRVEACLVTRVSKHRLKRTGDEASVWPGRKRWGEAVENLYAAFVERLFDYPVDQDLTWPNLHTLLRDREHNLLYDHLGNNEDEKLTLEPDCADLPYTLEAYFAWKLDLPYAFVVCNRGNGDHPPRCKDAAMFAAEAEAADAEALALGLEPEPLSRPPADNLWPRTELAKTDEVGAFASFAKKVMSGVNSASGRTGPGDEITDWYPVALTRESLRPGTLFADPYGHLMILVGWYPQTPGGYGILMGADAQPDSTVGRRRFWRGNYLFTSSTKFAGAGFKAYRPRFVAEGTVVPWENKALKKRGWWAPWSTQQYDGTTDDFYDRMEELINPRPLDALSMQISLVDALQEAVVRRINSVDNGEQFKKTAPGPISMPDGADIFLTSGPWEDFSTPSRDHRILVAIDTVIGLAAAVERRPERYRLDKADVPAMLVKLQAQQDELLAARTFEYVRTDGSKQTLTLADVVARQTAFEMAYNPNDCVEVRWGAPEGSPEASTCQRHAPASQRAKMEQYRHWFHDRERPIE